MVFQHPEGPEIFDQAIAQGTVKLQPVPVRTHPAVADQISGVLHGEEVLACCHRTRIMPRQLGLKFVVQRVTCFLIPKEVILGERLGIGDGRNDRWS